MNLPNRLKIIDPTQVEYLLTDDRDVSWSSDLGRLYLSKICFLLVPDFVERDSSARSRSRSCLILHLEGINKYSILESFTVLCETFLHADGIWIATMLACFPSYEREDFANFLSEHRNMPQKQQERLFCICVLLILRWCRQQMIMSTCSQTERKSGRIF